MKYTINLATATYINRRLLYSGYALLAAMLVGLLLFNLVNLTRSSSQRAAVAARLAELQGRSNSGVTGKNGATAAESAQLAQRIRAANDLLERDAYRWTALLNQLEAELTEGIGIRGLQPDYERGELKITGVAESVADLRRYLDRLAVSSAFSDVYLTQQGLESATDGPSLVSFAVELKRKDGI